MEWSSHRPPLDGSIDLIIFRNATELKARRIFDKVDFLFLHLHRSHYYSNCGLSCEPLRHDKHRHLHSTSPLSSHISSYGDKLKVFVSKCSSSCGLDCTWRESKVLIFDSTPPTPHPPTPIPANDVRRTLTDVPQTCCLIWRLHCSLNPRTLMIPPHNRGNITFSRAWLAMMRAWIPSLSAGKVGKNKKIKYPHYIFHLIISHYSMCRGRKKIKKIRFIANVDKV